MPMLFERKLSAITVQHWPSLPDPLSHKNGRRGANAVGETKAVTQSEVADAEGSCRAGSIKECQASINAPQTSKLSAILKLGQV
jgi:hypothetical protein